MIPKYKEEKEKRVNNVYLEFGRYMLGGVSSRNTNHSDQELGEFRFRDLAFV